MKRNLLILLMSVLVNVIFAQSTDYLCFTAVNGAATVKLTAVGNDIPSVSLQYSTNKTTWSTYSIDQVISLASGGKVYFKATSSNARLATYNSTTYSYSYHKFVMTGQVAASGKITSLISSTTTSKVVNTYAFTRLFENCTSLVSAPELPATTLSTDCYRWMFSGCTGLTVAPILPAMVMASGCYCAMFLGCTSLVSAPDLPATTMANICYSGMFMNCTGMTTAPASLPATTMVTDCCSEMFSGCTSLIAAPELPATTMAYRCYFFMFYGCTSLTTPPSILPATAMAQQCCWAMFSGCTSLQTTPQLPATTLADDCYLSMFVRCTSLTSVPTLPATTLYPSCYQGMFNGCSNIHLNLAAPGTVWKIPAAAASSASSATNWGTNMFKNTGGTMTGQPTPGQDYYICNSTPAPTAATITVNIQGQGTVTGAGTYNVGDTVTLTATPASGYTFAGWSNGSTSATISFVATGDMTLTANFTQSNDYLCFTAVNGSATVRLYPVGTPPSVSLQYSTNGTSWSSYTVNQVVSLKSGNKVYFRATNTNARFASNTMNYHRFMVSGKVAASGNVTSLIDKTMAAQTVNSFAYYNLFYLCSGLVSAPELPATTMANHCYSGMFEECTSLTSPPELPATTLAGNCYTRMFLNCTSLTTAPDLPATSLADSCYSGMFCNCSTLVATPALPATTLRQYCYKYMFQSCVALTSAPVLPSTAMVVGCYSSMFSYCSGLTVAPELPATTLANNCYEYMFAGCANLTSPPELPATTLAQNCYSFMFSYCTGLSVVPELSATSLYRHCYYNMFKGCTNIRLNLAGPGTIWKIPSAASSSASSAVDWGYNMFAGTGGTFTGQPTPGQNYYYYQVPATGTVTVVANPASGGSVTGGGTYNVGSTATLTATPASGYVFTGWSNGATSSTITITVAGDTTITANFQQQLDYLCFTAVNGAATVKLTKDGNPYSRSLQYSTNGTTWSSYTINQTISLSSGGKVYFKVATANNAFSSDNANYYYFVMTGTIAASGKITSLLDPNMTRTYVGNNSFFYLFKNCTSLISAPELPATTLGNRCYEYMFYGCTRLATAPELPAMTLNARCYAYMFQNCSTLTAAPDLPADSTFSHSYYGMFKNCTRLAVPPVISATRIAFDCCVSMFDGCTSLTTAPALPATILDIQCYESMFRNCTALTTPPAILPATTLAQSCYWSMFYGCTSLTTTPQLPAMSLELQCYDGMFRGCTSLTTVPDLPATTLAQSCYRDMFYGCTNIKLYPTGSGQVWKIPAAAATSAASAANWGTDMFTGSGGTLQGQPVVGQDYYYNPTVPKGMVTVVANPANGGSVTGGGMYNVGSIATLTATPAIGYHFTGWSNGSTSSSISFTVTGDTTFVASFAQNIYTVTGAANPANGGTVTGGGSYTHGSTVTLTATPATGYHFTGWSNGQTTTSISFTVTGNTTLVASFVQNIYTVTGAANPANGGVVVGGGSYTYGSNVTLTAVAVNGYRFTGWSNGVTSGTISFVVTGDTVLIANFVPVSHNVTVIANPASGGVVSGGGTYIAGSTATIIAIPATGYHFAGWSNGAVTDTLSFAVTGDTVLVANFVQNLYAVTLVANPTTGGTVSGGGAYSYGTAITITATPATGYRFTGWSDGSTASSRSMVVTDDVLLTANFDKITCTVTTIVDPASTGSISGGGTYYYGDTVTVVASAAYGYDFIGWHNSGDTSNVAWFVVTGDTVVIANFILIPYTVTAAVSDPSAGVVSGGGVYAAGDTAVISVTVADGYYFTGWSNGTTTTTISVVVAGDTTLTAMFGRYEHCLTVMVNDTSYGRVKVSGSYYHGDIVTLTAISDAHCRLAYWSTGDTTAVIQVMIVSDTTIEAFFEWDEYVVTAVSNDSACGMVRGSGVFRYGDVAELTAVAEDGCRFVSWDNGMTASSIQITVVKDTTLTAYFETIPEVGVEDVEVGEYVVYCEGRNIVVHEAEGRSVVVYDMTGRLVGMVADGSFEVYAAGVYLVAVDGRAVARVVVR